MKLSKMALFFIKVSLVLQESGQFEVPSLKKVSPPVERIGFQLGTVLEDKVREISFDTSNSQFLEEAPAITSIKPFVLNPLLPMLKLVWNL